MRCEQCGKMIEFQSPAIEATMREVCRQYQFNASGHTFVIRGTCAECNRARMTKRRLDLV
jgi:Fur family ferric uptake transcriptional regulator